MINSKLQKPLLFGISFVLSWELAVIIFKWGIKAAGNYTPFLVTVFLLLSMLIYFSNKKDKKTDSFNFGKNLANTLVISWTIAFFYAVTSWIIYTFLFPDYAANLAIDLKSMLIENGAPDQNIESQLNALSNRYSVKGIWLFKGLITGLQGSLLALVLSGLSNQNKQN